MKIWWLSRLIGLTFIACIFAFDVGASTSNIPFKIYIHDIQPFSFFFSKWSTQLVYQQLQCNRLIVWIAIASDFVYKRNSSYFAVRFSFQIQLWIFLPFQIDSFIVTDFSTHIIILNSFRILNTLFFMI